MTAVHDWNDTFLTIVRDDADPLWRPLPQTYGGARFRTAFPAHVSGQVAATPLTGS